MNVCGVSLLVSIFELTAVLSVHDRVCAVSDISLELGTLFEHLLKTERN